MRRCTVAEQQPLAGVASNTGRARSSASSLLSPQQAVAGDRAQVLGTAAVHLIKRSAALHGLQCVGSRRLVGRHWIARGCGGQHGVRGGAPCPTKARGHVGGRRQAGRLAGRVRAWQGPGAGSRQAAPPRGETKAGSQAGQSAPAPARRPRPARGRSRIAGPRPPGAASEGKKEGGDKMGLVEASHTAGLRGPGAASEVRRGGGGELAESKVACAGFPDAAGPRPPVHHLREEAEKGARMRAAGNHMHLWAWLVGAANGEWQSSCPPLCCCPIP